MEVDEAFVVLEKMLSKHLSAKLHPKLKKRSGLSYKETRQFDNSIKEIICALRGLKVKGEVAPEARSLEQLNFFWGVVVPFIHASDDRYKGRKDSIVIDEIIQDLKFDCGFYKKKTMELDDGQVYQFYVFDSISFDKTSQKVMNEYMERVDEELYKRYQTTLADLRREKKSEKKPPQHALRQGKLDAMGKKRLEKFALQCGICFGALFMGTSYEVSNLIPYELHHMEHNTIVNKKRLGKKFVDSMGNLVLLSSKYHSELSFLEKKHFQDEDGSLKSLAGEEK